VRTAATIVLAAALGLAPAAGAGASGQPALRFTGLVPVKVSGTGFAASERVRVTLLAGDARRVRTALTTRTGTFAVDFGTLARKDRCGSSISVSAVGATGDRASRRLPPRECVAAMTALPGH
jgi:hypothetical protein